MSRLYTIERRQQDVIHVSAEDGFQTRIHLLGVGGDPSEDLRAALAERGFVADGDVMAGEVDGVTVRVSSNGDVSASIATTMDETIERVASRRFDTDRTSEQDAIRIVEEMIARGESTSTTTAAAVQAEADRRVTRALESALPAIQSLLDAVGRQVDVAQLRRRAAELGQVVSETTEADGTVVWVVQEGGS